MKLDIYELSAKALVGEELTADEKKILHAYNTKYALVRYLIMEHRKLEGFDMIDFQFTPGDDFEKMSAIAVANAILESFSLPSEPLVFGDGSWILSGRAPVTGMEKKSLIS